MLSLISSKITVTKEKERKKNKARRRKGGEKKSNGFTLSCYNGYFGDTLAEKKLLDGKGPFGDNVFKNPARWPRGGHCHIKAV